MKAIINLNSPCICYTTVLLTDLSIRIVVLVMTIKAMDNTDGADEDLMMCNNLVQHYSFSHIKFDIVFHTNRR